MSRAPELPILTGLHPVSQAGVDSEPLPAVYGRWIDELIGPVPRESRAQCSECPMCATGGVASETKPFHPSAKCCTYVPELPNYLVGAALAEESAPNGQLSLEIRIRHQTAVTPLGIGVVPMLRLAYEAVADQAFGASEALRCPHYDESGAGSCGIWKHRNAECATWFCRHVRGRIGAALWAALRAFLKAVEAALSSWAALEAGLPTRELLRCLAYRRLAAAERLSVELVRGWGGTRSELWGTLAGREREFFASTAAKVQPLSLPDVLAVCGTEGRVAADGVRHAFAQAACTDLPSRLRPAPHRVLSADGPVATVATYGRFDSLGIATDLLHALLARGPLALADAARLAGRGDSVRGLAAVRMLVDHGVLVESQADTRTTPEDRT